MNMKQEQAAKEKAFGAPVTAEEMQRLPGRETKAKRTRAGKIFDLGRNLHQAVLFADQVHFQNRETGEWEEIDNTLIPMTDASGSTYLTNRANDELKAEFHPTKDATTIRLQNGEKHLLSWKLEGAGEAKPAHTAKARRLHDEDDLRRDVLDQLEDEALYPNVFPGVDMRCRVQSVSFKDELIFSTPESVRPVSFLMSMPGLSPEKRENGDIELVSDNGETVFTLPAPFMKDSKATLLNAAEQLADEAEMADMAQLTDEAEPAEPVSSTGAVVCEMEPTGEKDVWRMTCTPDTAWLETAVFPVILDPAVITTHHSTAIEDNFVTSAKPFRYVVSPAQAPIIRQA